MIASMLKARLVILKDDLEQVLKELQRSSCFMITKQEVSANNKLSNDGVIARGDQSIKNLSKYCETKQSSYLSVNYLDLEQEDTSYKDLIEKVEGLILERSNLLIANKALEEEIKSYRPMEGLTVKLNELINTKSAIIHLGYIATKYLNEFKSYATSLNLYHEVLNSYKNTTCVFFITYYADDEEILEQVKSYGFNDLTLPKYDGLVTDYINHLDNQIKDNLTKVENIEQTLSTYSNEIPKLKVYVDSLLTKKARDEVDYSETLEVYILDGYVAKDSVEKLTNAVEKVTPYYDLETSVPADDEDVPTCMQNNKFVAPFESITNMFSIPSWKEFDPNPIMSLWYWILFGMMMGDFGYGILLFVGALLFIKIKKPQKGTLSLAKVLLYSSIPTALWGIVFNSYFGFNLPFYQGIQPMKDAMTMLILSIAVGALHIITGLVVKMVKDIHHKEYFEMLAKDLSWICILIGIGAFAANMALKIEILKFIGIGLIIFGVALLLLFSGHKKKNIFAKGLSGILGLYDVTSYLGDLLSYTRIMALVMSSAAIASVMNTLAQMVGGNPIGYIFSGVIFIVGHIFNMVLGLLSAYVHDCRLQYIEFYGKFYDGGGTLFKPLSVETKYVNEITNIKGE